MALSENDKKQDKKEKPLSKVIVRRLPPTMDQEMFLHQVSPVPDYSYIYFVKGDSSLGEYAFSRAYINFINPEDIYDFKERFDNYVFVDSKGGEYPAVVEFAPFQKIPKKRGKIRMDPKCGSIETDPVYQEFIESLNKPQEQDEKPEYTLQLSTMVNDSKNDVMTPLLEYIKNKRAQKIRSREIRREERKRREFDRRKERYDDRKKNDGKISNKATASQSKSDVPKEEKVTETSEEATSAISTTSVAATTEDAVATTTNKTKDEKPEKVEKVFEKSYYKSKERKFEDKKHDERKKDIKLRYPRKEYVEHRDYKRVGDYREREYAPKYDTYKKEEKGYQRKVKKYSEKREERKMEAQRAEQSKKEKLEKDAEDKSNKEEPDPVKPNVEADVQDPGNEAKVNDKKDVIKKEDKIKDADPAAQENNPKEKEPSESQSQRRIRNKDRPTIAIYRPGMLSKRKQVDTDPTDKEKNENKN